MNKTIIKKIKEVINRLNKEKVLSRIIMLSLSLVIASFLFNTLIMKTKIITGGVNGVAIIFLKICNIDPSITIFILSFILFIFSCIFLGFKNSIGTLIATFIYPVLVKITANYTNNFIINTDDLMLICLYIGLIGGVANGLMYKSGYSNGGLPIISQILYKYFNISIGKSSFIINGSIVILGGFLFSWINVLYAFIILYINSSIIDKIIKKNFNSKIFLVFSKDIAGITYYLENVLMYKKYYFNYKENILVVNISVRDYIEFRKIIHQKDRNAYYFMFDIKNC